MGALTQQLPGLSSDVRFSTASSLRPRQLLTIAAGDVPGAFFCGCCRRGSRLPLVTSADAEQLQTLSGPRRCWKHRTRA